MAKTVLLTGALGPNGREIAQLFHEQGYQVVIQAAGDICTDESGLRHHERAEEGRTHRQHVEGQCVCDGSGAVPAQHHGVGHARYEIGRASCRERV